MPDKKVAWLDDKNEEEEEEQPSNWHREPHAGHDYRPQLETEMVQKH